MRAGERLIAAQFIRRPSLFAKLLPAAALLFLAAAAPAASDDPYLWLEEVQGDRALAQVRSLEQGDRGRPYPRSEIRVLPRRARAILDDERQIATPDQIFGDRVANLWRDARIRAACGACRRSPPTAPAGRSGGP
jgi:prolyl oligopeptidase